MPEIDRRSLLAGMAAIGAMATMEQSASAAAPFFKRIGKPIGLQIYTLGDTVGKDVPGTFAQVSALGYREIELPSLFGHTPAEIRKAADAAGLAISSLHLVAAGTHGPMPGLSLTSEPAAIADAVGALGAKRVVMPIVIFPADFKPLPGESVQAAIGRSVTAAGPDLWKRTAALLNERGAKLAPLGVRVGYHNHNMEFAPLGATRGWDILANETDPKLVDFEVDIGWVATAGVDPVAFLTQQRGRVRQLHVKDVAAGNATNFALSMKPAEVGSGTLNWAKILPAALAAGVEHFYVEQEPPFTIPRIEAAKRSYDYLAKLSA